MAGKSSGDGNLPIGRVQVQTVPIHLVRIDTLPPMVVLADLESRD
jgi:hypothetical protein